MTARTIWPEEEDRRDGVTGSGSCPLVAAGLRILSARRRAQLWILTAGGGWPLALAWATACPALNLACGRLLGEGGLASVAATRRRDSEEGGATRGGEEVGLHDGEEDVTTGGGEEAGTT